MWYFKLNAVKTFQSFYPVYKTDKLMGVFVFKLIEYLNDFKNIQKILLICLPYFLKTDDFKI